MVATFHKVALHLGWTEEEARALAGHALRPTGAQHMARHGIELFRIQLFCRWESSTVLKYLRDIPLEGSETWLSEGAADEPLSLKEIIFIHFLCL